MVICVEGARNVGKSYLLSKLNEHIYKFSFVDIVKELNILNNDERLHYLSLGADIAFIEHFKEHINNHIIDRNFLSSLVFAVQANRITLEEAIKQGKYIKDNFESNFKIIYITADYREDNRNKDEYDFYKQNETIELYEKLIKEIDLDIIRFHNNFDEQSVIEFLKLME